MRLPLVALLLFATAAHAQWVSPVEETYGPYVRPLEGGRPALASSSSRVILAWSESAPPRIHTGVLDFAAHLVTPIEVLPEGSSNAVDDVMPAAASDGSSFFVVWVERDEDTRVLRGAPVSADGVPGVSRTYGTVVTIAADELIVPSIAWDGSNYRAYSGSSIYTIAPDGELRHTVRASTREVAVAGAKGVIATAQSVHQPLWTCCNLEAVNLVWTAWGLQGKVTIVDRRQRLSPTASTPNIAPTADTFAIAWASFEGIGYLIPGQASFRGISAEARLDVSPGLACDDKQCIVAYGTESGDVQALVFEPASSSGALLFPVAVTERRERSPQVVNLGAGRFLVAYLSDQGDEHRIAGRIVLTNAPRKSRAVRP